MYKFNEEVWKEKIKNPLWYLEVPPEMKKLISLKSESEVEFQKVKEKIYSFFETELNLSNIFLGEIVKNFDEERKEIDTIVIHHTHGDTAMTKERLSAMELVRLYAPYFANPTYENDQGIKGKAIYSGHFRNNCQVFYPYHWFINSDGSLEELLHDSEVGWHSGNWEINCKSVAIALNGNYENSTPSKIELESIARLISEKYPQVKVENILGHREINLKTTCPSNLFLSEDNKRGWKEDLMDLLKF